MTFPLVGGPHYNILFNSFVVALLALHTLPIFSLHNIKNVAI